MEQSQERKLTAKEKAWADAYLATFNKTEAARRAKYKGDNRTLAHVGWENYRKAHIQAYLKDKLDQMAMPANEVLTRLARMAQVSIEDYIEIQPGGRTILVDLEAAREAGVLGLIKKLKVTKEGPEIELYDAQVALIQLGRANGIFVDKIAPTDPTGENEYAGSARDELISRLADIAARAAKASGPGGTE